MPLAARLHASIGAELSLSVIGVGTVRGRLTRVGRDWLMLGAEDRSWVVRSAAVTVVAGASSRAVSEAALPPEAGLGLGSMLRHPDRAEWVFWTVTGEQRRGLPHRVGHDFVEVRTPGELLLIPFAALAAIQR